jgi:hypothetical protein
MSWIAAGTATVAVVGGVIKANKAKKEKKKAELALANLKTPDKQNIADGLTVSTRGADLRREELGRNSANVVDSIRGAGVRGIVGGIGSVQANNNSINADISANLDEQQKDIDKIKANDKVRLQGIEEDRYIRDVEGLSSQINSASNDKRQANAQIIGGITSAGTAIGGKYGDKGKKTNDNRFKDDSAKFKGIGYKPKY